MAMDFPVSPALNDTYTFSGQIWQWNGYAWDNVTPGTDDDARLDALETLTTTHTSEIDALETLTGTHTTQIAALVAADVVHTSDIDALELVDVSLQDQIDTHTTQIAALDAEIDALGSVDISGPNHTIPVGAGTGNPNGSVGPGVVGSILIGKGASADPAFLSPTSLASAAFGNDLFGAILTNRNGVFDAAWLGNNNVIDARLFGVVGDAVTNNTSALQAAIDYAATLSNRSEVVLPYGQINIGSTVTMKQGVTLRGQGAALVWSGVGSVKYGTRIKWTGSTSTGIIIDSPATVAHDWGIKNLTIDGGVTASNAAIAASSLKAIRVRSGFYQRIEDVSIQLVGYGISFEPNFTLGSPSDLIEFGNYRNVHMYLINIGMAFCINGTLANLTSGGTTNNQFYNITMYAYVTRAFKFHCMSDDNRFTGGFVLSSATGSVGIEFNSLSPSIHTGVYGNTFVNFEVQCDGSSEYGIVQNNSGAPDVPFGNSFVSGGLFAGTSTPYVISYNGSLTVSTDTDLWAQEIYRNFPAQTGMRIVNDYADSAASAAIQFGTDVDASHGIIQANSQTNIDYGGIFSFNIGNQQAARTCLITNDLVRLQIGSAGAITFNAYTAGTLSTDGAGAITASDERLKNITGPCTYGLAEIKQIEPIAFSFKNAPDVLSVGLSAQNVQKAIPEAIGSIPSESDANTRYLNVDDRAVIAALVNAVKELDAKVSAMKLCACK